jgi:hypothetical protein
MFKHLKQIRTTNDDTTALQTFTCFNVVYVTPPERDLNFRLILYVDTY